MYNVYQCVVTGTCDVLFQYNKFLQCSHTFFSKSSYDVRAPNPIPDFHDIYVILYVYGDSGMCQTEGILVHIKDSVCYDTGHCNVSHQCHMTTIDANSWLDHTKCVYICGCVVPPCDNVYIRFEYLPWMHERQKLWKLCKVGITAKGKFP